MPHLADAVRRSLPVDIWSTVTTVRAQSVVARNIQDVSNAAHAHASVRREHQQSDYDSLIAGLARLNLNDTVERSEIALSPDAAAGPSITAETTSGATTVDQAPGPALQSVSLPVELLWREARTLAARFIADLATLAGEPNVLRGQWRSCVGNLMACLDVFRGPGPGGLGLDPEERARFGALLECPVVDGLSLRKVAQLWDSGAGKFATSSGREQLTSFIHRVQVALDIESEFSPEALHQHWLRSVIQAIDDIASLVEQQPLPDQARWEAASDALFVCLEHFADLEKGGRWLSPEGRTAITELRESPFDDAMAPDETAARREDRALSLDPAAARAQVATFLQRARSVIATHAANVDDDTKRALLREPVPRPHGGGEVTRL